MTVESRGIGRYGYALGMGLAFLPLVGIPLRFMFSGTPALLSYGGAFLAGALVGMIAWSGGGRRKR